MKAAPSRVRCERPGRSTNPQVSPSRAVTRSTGLQIDVKLQKEDMVYQVCIAGQLAAVDHLVLVAHIHVEVTAKGSVDADEESVLVYSRAGSFARDRTDRIEVHEYFIVGNKSPFRGGRDRNGYAEHLAEPYGSAVRVLDPPLLQPRAA